MPDAKSPTTHPAWFERWRKPLIWAGSFCAALGLSYLVGRLHTSGRIDDAETQASAAQTMAAKQVSEVSGLRQQLQRLQARRQLHLMLLALDDRNFGIVEQHQKQAAELLLGSTGEQAGEFSKLQHEIQEFRLVAAEDLAMQRAKVMSWVNRFDELMPPAAVK